MKRVLAALLALVLLLSLCACGNAAAPVTETAAPAAAEQQPSPVAEAPAEVAAPGADGALPVSVMVLSGTTGFGMAKLMDDAVSGTAALNYRFSVETDVSNITAALVNGSCDIAALPTNAAASLYQKSGGAVQCLALNTRGVLYVVTSDESVTSFADLDGKTVYVPAQNPAFIVSALARGFRMASAAGTFDLTADTTYAQPADLLTAVSSGKVTLAVLPEPMVTVACAGNENLRVALDVTEVWDHYFPAGSLVQGCAVVRREFAEAHPAEVAQFLTEYGTSIAFLSEDTGAAAEMIVNAGIFAKAPVAEKAIPRCNVCFLTGVEMKSAMSTYLELMFQAAPQSVGGALPGDDFYYISD